MRFGILGPLEVRADDRAVALGGRKPRAVLAVLLLKANEPVSVDQLATALWGEDAPAGAVSTVQVHISRLRKALGDDDGTIVTTTPGGYRLRVRPGELDVERFDRLVAEGNHLLERGQPEQAAEVLREALDLWRGPPLADLEFEPFAQREIERLEEKHLAATDTRIEADLAAGRHGELVPELRRLVADHPTSERLAGHLMISLYRSGRQTEALDAYRETRQRLVSEVGIEPGPELAKLQERILHHHPSLGFEQELPQELDVSAAPPLLGRDAEMSQMLRIWDDARAGEARIIVVAGVAGIGKSRLAAELATRAYRTGAAVRYASGAGPPATAREMLRGDRNATQPLLLVLEEADRAGGDLLGAVRQGADRGTLVVAAAEVPARLEALEPDAVILLEGLDAAAVGGIAALYAPGHAVDDVPAEWLLGASAGVPSRVHDLARAWARREAARRIGAVAAGRAELRTMEQELAGGIEQLQTVSEWSPPSREVTEEVVCPFKGLASFEAVDAPYFFGRERLIAELVARLVGAPLLGVLGPSGSGKSSVVRAGLLPALKGGVLPGSDAWPQALMRPGEHPMRELGAALDAVGDGRFVLAVDQFEETFTFCEDEAERSAFISELVRVSETGVVILAIRADHYGRCAAYPDLARVLAANHVLVGRMQRHELRRAIACPAERAGLSVEAPLVDALVDDVADAPGALPLLSTALLELWQHRDGRSLRHSSYQQTGGVRGAVARLAEDAFGRLDPTQQAVARNVLVLLAAEGADGAVERRRVPLAELAPERSDDVTRVVDLFTERRLLTVSAGTVEVAHEALLREWPRLSRWIEEDREKLRIQRVVTGAAEEWQRQKRDDEALLRGGALVKALEWRSLRAAPLNELESDFLTASEARWRQERSARRRRRRLAFAGLTAVLMAGIAIAIVVIFAERERDLAASRDLATKSVSLNAADPALGLAVALEALERHDTPQARNAVRQATYAHRGTAMASAHEGVAFQVVLAPDGDQLATSGEDGAVRTWTVDGLRPVSTIESNEADAITVAYSPDGETIASTHSNGDIMLNPVSGGEPRRLLRLEGGDFARSVGFSRDGEHLLIGTNKGVVGLVRIGDEAPAIRRLGKHGQRVRTAFAPDGTKAVSASDDGTARIWSLAGGSPIVLEHPTAVTDADFSPDGGQLATAGFDGFARLWDTGTGELIRQIRVDDGIVGGIRFSPDARRLVAVGDDAAVRIVSVDGGPVIGELRGHAGPAYAAIFTDGGDTVVSVGLDGTLRKWAPLQVAALPVGGSADAPFQVGFSPDGRHMVSGYTDGDVRIWDVTDGSHTDLPGHPFESVASYSPNGRFIVSASAAGTVRLWDVERRRSRPVASEATIKNAAAVDSTGQWVATAALDAPTVIQRPDGSDRIELRGHEREVNTLAFSPDGKHLLSAAEDATVRIWSTADGSQERVLEDHDKAVVYAAFSSDGREVVTAETDGTVRTWSLAGEEEARVLYGHELQVNFAEFSQSGDRVVTAGQDGTVRVWDSSGGEPILIVHEREESVTAAHFSADGERVLSVGEDGYLLSFPCEGCGSFSDVLELASTRLERTLTSADRQRLQLGED